MQWTLRQALPIPPDWAGVIQEVDPTFAAGDATLTEGATLSQEYCGVCHLRPDPAVLPQKSWLEVVNHHILIVGARPIPESDRLALPAKPLRGVRIPGGEFAKVIYYYLKSAPGESLPVVNRPAMDVTNAPFKIAHAEPVNPFRPAMFTLASIAQKGKRIVLGDAVEKTLLVLQPKGDVMHRLTLSGVPTGFVERPEGLVVTQIGMEAYSTTEAKGEVLRIPLRALDTPDTGKEVLLSNLQRPVHTTIADVDGDGSEELLVEEFGFSDGSLGYYERLPGGAYEHRVLIDLSGALSSFVGDFNGDNFTDILALVSQATESVFMLWGRGEGKFETEKLHQSQPGFGANQLLIGDMNNDGHTDLILINGDSLDLPSNPISKDDGIHILLNDGKNHFREQYFFPMVGAVQALLRDFDRDGDLDIAAVSATPDFSRRPLETFVYLENQGNMAYVPRGLPVTDRGCWSVLDAGDLDDDGDEDLVLGAAYVPLFENEINAALGSSTRYSYLILENTSSQPGAKSPNRPGK